MDVFMPKLQFLTWETLLKEPFAWENYSDYFMAYLNVGLHDDSVGQGLTCFSEFRCSPFLHRVTHMHGFWSVSLEVVITNEKCSW